MSTTQQLVQSFTPKSPAISQHLIERLYAETEGLPFFLVEYLTAIANNTLNPEQDAWWLPDGVSDLLRSRLLPATELGRQLLHTAASIGRSFDFDTLCEASGRSEEETITALEELIALGLVEELGSSTPEQSLVYDFSHEKLRFLVYAEMSLARRRLLHRRIAEVLVGQAQGARKTDIYASQIAHHYHMAGNESMAANYFLIAGERARSLYANAEALSHFRMALALGHPDAAALHEALGDV